jgi:hypothetical protein
MSVIGGFDRRRGPQVASLGHVGASLRDRRPVNEPQS